MNRIAKYLGMSRPFHFRLADVAEWLDGKADSEEVVPSHGQPAYLIARFLAETGRIQAVRVEETPIGLVVYQFTIPIALLSEAVETFVSEMMVRYDGFGLCAGDASSILWHCMNQTAAGEN